MLTSELQVNHGIFAACIMDDHGHNPENINREAWLQDMRRDATLLMILEAKRPKLDQDDEESGRILIICHPDGYAESV